MDEIWRDIKDYENYQVSSKGRIKSKEKEWTCGINNNILKHEEIIMKPQLNKKTGYLQITLRKNNKTKHFRVHRLVAEAFIPNPDNLREVNHKDENKENNSVENLEWCTPQYNINYGTRNERTRKAHTKLIKCSDGEINTSCYFAKKYNKTKRAIQNCANKNDKYHKSINGFTFEYVKEVI